MIANYHTHTPRCNHARGTETEYVECALEAGLQILGFSDHSPYLFPGGYVSWFRMTPEQLTDYTAAVLALRQTYRGRIDLPLGLEMEYYPGCLDTLLPILRDQPLDYLILGQHFLGDEAGEHYCGHPTADARHLERYCDQSIEAMHTGLYTYFAHPDLIRYVGGDDRLYRRQMTRLCREAKQCGLPLELNLLGLLENRHYPAPCFWEIAAQEGCQVILGRDAHTPQQLLDRDALDRALAMAAVSGLTPLDTVPLRKPF